MRRAVRVSGMTFAKLVVALSLAAVAPTTAAAEVTCATPVLGRGGSEQGTTCHGLTVNGV